MKISFRITIVCGLTAVASAVFTPYSITFESLLQSTPTTSNPIEPDSALITALTTSGMVTVRDLPSSFKEAMLVMTATQDECLMESKNTQEQTYPDGTVRTTLATHTVAGAGGKQQLLHATTDLDACIRFVEATNIVRETAQAVVAAFATKITTLWKVEDGPLLVTKSNENDYEIPFAFDAVTDIVKYGEHLEHFHSYSKKSTTSTSNNNNVDDITTIDFHTDQGLFLVFTPGRLTNGEQTCGFYIKTMEGTTEEVHFSDTDDLVFMLGDGVNQYINDKIDDSYGMLRAVPHSVRLESSEQARIWYGLMVLPPASALHPLYGDISFGELRQGLMTGNTHLIHLACSPSDSARNLRQLQDVTCENADEIYCWHQCMNSTTFNVSADTCTAQSRELRCVSPRNQIWDGGDNSHGDFFPGCAENDWVNQTAYTTLPNFPRDDVQCTDFATFYDDDMYLNSVSLNDGAGALFQYNVTTDGMVHGRLAFNGIFGFLAFGHRGVGGFLQMFNASIILATRGGDFSPVTGLNLTLEPEVHEYVTSSDPSPEFFGFRHWSVPYGGEDRGDNDDHDDGTNDTATSLPARSGIGRALDEQKSKYWVDTENDACYTALYFEVNSIAGQGLNLMGEDELIWSANSNDYFMGYHGNDRGNFTIDWAAAVTDSELGGTDMDSDTGGTTGTVGGQSTGSSTTSLLSGMLIGGVTSFLFPFFTFM